MKWYIDIVESSDGKKALSAEVQAEIIVWISVSLLLTENDKRHLLYRIQFEKKIELISCPKPIESVLFPNWQNLICNCSKAWAI